MQSLYNAIFGQPPGPTNITNLANPAVQSAVNSAFNSAYQQYGQSQAAQNQSQLAQQQYNQVLGQYHQQRVDHKWMINGRGMDFAEFVDTLCPNPEDPMRSLLILKYAGIKK